MKPKKPSSSLKKFFVGWLGSYLVFLLLIAFIGTDNFARAAGQALPSTLFGAAIVLVGEKLSSRQLSMLVFAILCVVVSFLLGVMTVANQSG